MTESLSQRLAALAARPVGDRARADAAVRVLDWLGCALLGATARAGSVLGAHGRTRPAGPCLAIGAGRRDAETAALVNGGLGNIFEMDDLHRTSIVHPADVVIPAALAVAERHGIGAVPFLDAVVAGYEVAVRVGLAAGRGHYRYWYPTATCGVFGAAAAAAMLRGLDGGGMADALGQAGMQASGLWQCRIEPTHSKQLAAGRAAQSGVIAADLAKLGLAGPRQILEGTHGFFAAACPDAEPERAAADTGAPWKILETSFKPWPTCRHSHSVIEAVLGLRDGFEAGAVAGIDIFTYREAVEFCDKPAPESADDARFSLQHCAALALARGAPELADFEAEGLADAAVSALRAKATVGEDIEFSEDFPERYGARVEIRLDDGARHQASVATAKGDPENPMSVTEIEAKAEANMAFAGLGREQAESLIAACRALANGGPMAALGESLAAAPAASPRDVRS